MSGKTWTEYEDRKLRKALMEGGVPLAHKRLPHRSEQAIYHRMRLLGWEVLTVGPVELATATDLVVDLDLSWTAAYSRLRHNVLRVRRGRYQAIPRCHLQAMFNRRPPPLEDLPRGYLTSAQTALILGITPTYFQSFIGPTIEDRLPYSGPGGPGGVCYAYQEDVIYALARERAA